MYLDHIIFLMLLKEIDKTKQQQQHLYYINIEAIKTLESWYEML